MKRHPSLHALSEHHHHALVQALDIRRAAEFPPPERGAAFLRVAEKFLGFWETVGQAHFREEEEILLPALARHERLDQNAEVMRMLADHAAIRAEVAQLAEDAASSQPVEARLASLGQMLQDHVRFEEDHIFPRIETELDEEELREMGRRLTRLHKKGN